MEENYYLPEYVSEAIAGEKTDFIVKAERKSTGGSIIGDERQLKFPINFGILWYHIQAKK